MPDINNNEYKDLSLDGLKGNLEKKLGPDQVVGSDQFLMVSPPGISIGNIRQFLEDTFSEIPGLGDIIPDSLPVDGVTLSYLTFLPKSTEHPYLLEFSIGWPSAHWEMIPGVLSLEAPEITVSVEGGQLSGSASGNGSSTITGTVSGVVEIGPVPLYIKVELPNGHISAQLVKVGDKVSPYDEAAKIDAAPSSAALMRQFQVSAPGSQESDATGVDLKWLTLDDLMVLGSIPARRLLFHLALGHITIGPGDMALQLTVDYFGGPESQVSGMVWGQYDLFKKGTTGEARKTDAPLFSLMLSAAYDGPGKSWKFEGGAMAGGASKPAEGQETPPATPAPPTTITDLIGVFMDDTTGIPGVLDKLAIKYLHLSYETGPGNFEFSCNVEALDLFGPDTEVEMIVDVQLRRTVAADAKSSSYEKTFSGRLLFKLENDLTLEFDLLFDQSPHGAASDTTFLAAYKNPSGGDINIGDLLSLIEPGLDVPLSIKLQDAFFIYDKKGSSTPAVSNSLFGLDIGGGLDLSALPLVGKILPKDASLNFGLQPLIAIGTPQNGAYFNQEELARLSALIPGGGITLPAQAITAQVGLGINISIGKDTSFHFDLPIKMAAEAKTKPAPVPLPDSSDAPPPAPSVTALQPAAGSAIQESDPKQAMTTSPATTGTTPAPSGSSASGIQWIKVQKAFGPISFNRIGLQYADKKVWAYLDAGLSIGPLTFTLDGLGVGTPINKLDPEFKLLGIGIDYESGPVKIAAAFLRTEVPADATSGTPAYDEYAGLASIQTPTIGLSAIGAYADLPNYKSLFIYAALHAPIGGPAFFFVTGLAAGFGFNRAVKVPDVSLVGEFPLVNLAVGGAGSPVPREPGGRSDYVHGILDQLRTSIYPQQGQYFLAAGIRFSSFQMIDSFVLLMVSFGQHFEVDVLGLSTLIVPTPIPGPPGAPAVSPIAEVQLAIKVVFNPAEGFLGVQAQLTGNSFVLDRACHITGGFAFFCWFLGPHQGDFIISLGGYHPDFQKPDWYPDVPRLGLNWQVTPELSIKGGVYFALCPHMLMAGGRMEATYHGGTLKASFVMGIDLLVAWKPFHYDAHAYLDISVDYTYHLFGTNHISLHVNADLHIWGPDFAGQAHVHLWCITFDIAFGAIAAPKPQPIDWVTFQKSFLPEVDKMAHLTVTDGLLQKQGDDVHVIKPKEFKMTVDLAIPFKELKIGDQTLATVTLHTTVERQEKLIVPFFIKDTAFVQPITADAITPIGFGIASMALGHDQVNSTFTFEVKMKNAEGGWEDAGKHFGYRPVLKRMPIGLWGERLEADLNGERYVENVLTGLEIIPANPPTPGETHWVAKNNLSYTTTHVVPGISFEPMQAFIAGNISGPAKTYLGNQLTEAGTMQSRRDMLEALGFDYDRLGLVMAPEISDALVLDPQVGQMV